MQNLKETYLLQTNLGESQGISPSRFLLMLKCILPTWLLQPGKIFQHLFD